MLNVPETRAIRANLRARALVVKSPAFLRYVWEPQYSGYCTGPTHYKTYKRRMRQGTVNAVPVIAPTAVPSPRVSERGKR